MPAMSAPLAVGGNRLEWHELPSRLLAAIETAAGGPVRSAASQPGGFSPGMASVLRLEDRRSVFVKAVNADRNPESPEMHRREAAVLRALPAAVPAPSLLWSYDDGDWVALMTGVVDGRPPAQPWRPDELTAFLDAAATLAGQLTPAPLPAPTVQEYFSEDFTGWRRLAGAPGAAGLLPPWARRLLPRLAELEQGWPQAAGGATLLHADLRADNVLFTDRGVVTVDWPHACVGAAWVDLLLALPSIAMHGGGDPQELWSGYGPARAADPDAVTAVLAAVTGFFLWGSTQPPPPNLERVRGFQRAQGEAGLAWLRRRIDPA
jgi:aminoglycoside phosphotransferase (APT) family kinase protein